MGYMRHDAVIVTANGYARDAARQPRIPDIDTFRAVMPEKFRHLVIGPIRGVVNDYESYMFAPDGSKEGWADSDTGDEWREKFVALFSATHSDGSSPFDVVTVRFGGDGDGVEAFALEEE